MPEPNFAQQYADTYHRKTPYNLWHIFVAEEMYKMSTFRCGGLWCAELNSIISFNGDVEGTQPFGIFVSCWHRSKDVPTARAWEIFGDSGNGFALRAQPSFMQSVAARFSTDKLHVRFDQVQYRNDGQTSTDPAFEVTSSHKRKEEEEMRLAISFPEIADPDYGGRKEQIRKSIAATCSNPRGVTKFENITFVECEGKEAIVLPVSPADLIAEIMIGHKVSRKAREELTEMLKGSELSLKVRTESSLGEKP